MPSAALEVSLELVPRVPRLPPVLPVLRGLDPLLHRQIRVTASSVPLNRAPGRRWVGRDRLHQFYLAAGSADGLRMALLVARACGDLVARALDRVLAFVDCVLAMLWRMAR